MFLLCFVFLIVLICNNWPGTDHINVVVLLPVFRCCDYRLAPPCLAKTAFLVLKRKKIWWVTLNEMCCNGELIG